MNVPTEEQIQLEARLAAIEFVLETLFVSVTRGITDEQFDQLAEKYALGFSRQSVPGLDAALSDHTTAEVADQVSRLMTEIKSLRLQSRNPLG